LLIMSPKKTVSLVMHFLLLLDLTSLTKPCDDQSSISVFFSFPCYFTSEFKYSSQRFLI
jgi:hypothetical protein